METGLAKRDSGHHMNKKGFGPAKLDSVSQDPGAIRGREQLGIEGQRQLGKSANSINGISPNNPHRDSYIDAEKTIWGIK